MADPTIIIPKDRTALEKEALAIRMAEENNFMPLRILCPKCQRIYALFIENLEQGLHSLLGQACPFCKRFIKEEDDPEKLLVDLAEIRQLMKQEQNNGLNKN